MDSIIKIGSVLWLPYMENDLITGWGVMGIYVQKLLRYHTALVTGKVSVFGTRPQVHFPNNLGENFVDVHLRFGTALNERAVPDLCKGLQETKATHLFRNIKSTSS